MQYSIIFSASLSLSLTATVSAHGIIRNVVGANGVSMPGLGGKSASCSHYSLGMNNLTPRTVADGTPRDCVANSCGAQADTCIIRDAEIAQGKSPLGWTQGNGEVTADKVVAAFMGRGNNAPTNSGASGAVGVEDDLSAQRNQRREEHMNEMRDTFSSFLNLPGIGALGLGGKPSSFPKETLVGDMAGQGAVKGMPTSNDDGDISLVYRQVCKN